VDIVSRQLLRAVRGARSQVAFARKLGYLGNPIADWEAGRRCPSASEALRACEVAGIDVAAAFARFHRVALHRVGAAFALDAWLTELKGSMSATELAARAGRSRQQVGRWLNGKAQPPLDDFLCLTEAITGRVCDLIAALVPIEKVPSVEKDYKERLAARQLAHEEPWTEAILRCMETESYRARTTHEPGAIAHALGIDSATEVRCLQKLEHAGVIVRRGERYEPARSLTVDTRAIPQLKAHWSRVAEGRLAAPQPNDVSCYNLMCASEEDIERIRQLLLATFREIRAIVEHTPREQAVALVNLQLVNFADERLLSQQAVDPPTP
jgi:transcriptional regulator with XRE-family HTH domain